MSEYKFDCKECDFENEVPQAVVELCSEHWRNCDNCRERNKLDLSGKL